MSRTASPYTRATVVRPLPTVEGGLGAGGGLMTGAGLNVAVTVSAWLIDTVHVLAVPEHPAPDQPANTDPDPGVSDNVTDEPCANDAEHVLPQSIPDGLLETDPDPEPARDTDNV